MGTKILEQIHANLKNCGDKFTRPAYKFCDRHLT